MKQIWKIPLPFFSALTTFDIQTVSIPFGAEILKVAIQKGDIYLWVLVRPDRQPEDRRFAIVGTGWDLKEESIVYIDTVFLGDFVWHIHEVLGGDHTRPVLEPNGESRNAGESPATSTKPKQRFGSGKVEYNED